MASRPASARVQPSNREGARASVRSPVGVRPYPLIGRLTPGPCRPITAAAAPPGGGTGERREPGSAAAEGGPVKAVTVEVELKEQLPDGALVSPLPPFVRPALEVMGSFIAAVRIRVAATT